MNEVTTIGVDLAKNIFQVHGVDAEGAVVVRRQLRRGQVLPFFKKQRPCLVGMEACATSHHWAREIEALGAPGAFDAAALGEALCEAEQERHGGCGSDLRGGDTADHAVCRDQDTGSAIGVNAAPDP